ncbi:MAG: D-alanyl-lipoteichoic acid biosynthesis protein DltB [Blautia sp.]|nr:D-alanyl-lipoteichoic acid biosynthesis protein DltB [Blautia sp.]
MTMYGEVGFFLLLLVLLLPAFLLGVFEKKRALYILLVSVFFDAAAIGRNPAGIVVFILYVVWETGISQYYQRLYRKQGRNGRTYAAMLILALLPLVISKVTGVFGYTFFQILGISYLTFKSLQVVIEIYDGLIKDMTPFQMAGFLLFFPTVTSGPIDRSRRYLGDLEKELSRAEYLEMAGDGLEKLLLGAVYKFVIAAGCYHFVSVLAEEPGAGPMIGYMYAYGLYLFFDFAGYSLMAIGCSYFLGIRTPENFNRPFQSKDIREFWDRWHISLSHWFRDFLFTRFVMQSARHKWFKNRLTTACVGFMINMTVMGIWHGLTLYYILYGVYHGVLLAATEIRQKRSGFHKKHKKEKWYQVISWAVTMQLVMFGFLLFSGHLL